MDRYDNLDVVTVQRSVSATANSYETFPNLTADDFFGSDEPLFHQVVAHDRVDLLATTYFKDPTKWWVILMANGKSLPTDLVIGEVIRIPASTKRVEAIIRRKVIEHNDTD